MQEEVKKSRIHIHLGGLIIVIIIFLVLFKIDIRSKIQSPQFQENLSYIEEQSKNIWNSIFEKPINNLLNNQIDKIRKGTIFDTEQPSEFDFIN